MSTVVKDLGAVSAYAYAVEKGYTGTEAEFAELMADYAEVGQRAEDAADSALESKTAAQTAATTATNKASEATTAATTATTKAGEASTSASTATSAKDTAVSASQTATSKATEATTAAATATSAKTDAVAANTAAQSAKTAAQTAQAGAETAAASVSASAAQIATNAEDISQLKSEKADVTDMLKAFPTDTASGAVVSFADGANVPVKSLIVNIDPVQEGSGAPSPTNMRPISGWSEVNVQRTGKNLAELTDPQLTTNTSEVVAQLNQKGTFNYTVSFDLINATYQAGSGALIALVDENGVEYRVPGQIRRVTDGEYLNALTQPINGRFYCTFVSKVNPVRVTIFFMSGSYGHWTGEMKNVQVELGTAPTDFEPYSGQSINISLGQTVYGGTLDVTKGELVIDRAMADLGTLNWSYVTISTNLIVFESRNLVSVIASRSIISDTYKNPYTDSTTTSAINNAPDKSIGVNKGPNQTGSLGVGAVFVKDSAYTDATAFKTAMSGAMLCYPLATPITVQLTPHEVTALLGSNNIWADSGDTEVTYRADPTLYIGRLTEPDADMIADANITSGQYFMVGNTLYKATANIASGATISPNVNCTRKSLSEALNELNA